MKINDVNSVKLYLGCGSPRVKKKKIKEIKMERKKEKYVTNEYLYIKTIISYIPSILYSLLNYCAFQRRTCVNEYVNA